MAPTRAPHDPFTEAATIRPATSFASAARELRNPPASRSTASTATSHSRQQIGLFAPPRSRRPSNRATPSFEDDVHADETEEDELTSSQQLAKLRQAQSVRVRHRTPETRSQKVRNEEEEFVKRRPDGGYLREVQGMDAALAELCMAEDMQAEMAEREVDAAHVEDARKYFKTAPSSGGRASEKHETDWEAHSGVASSWIKSYAMEKLETERWRWEPADTV